MSFALYVARGVVISLHFKRIPLLPSRVPIAAPYGTISGRDGEPLSGNSLAYDVYVDVGYAKALSKIQGWNYRDRVVGALNYFGIDVASTKISKILKDAAGGVEVGVISGKKASNIPAKYRPFLNIHEVYVKIPVATPNRILAKALQKEYGNYLKPKKDGEIIYNSFGAYVLSSKIKKIVKPMGGDEIFTSIDPRIQSFAYSAIEKEVKTQAASGGEVIVSDPQTGAILAMVSTWPWNAPVMNVCEIGSTVKPLVFAAALQEGVVSTNTTFSVPYFIPSPKIPLVIRDAEYHPWPITLRQALVYSSDVAEMTIARKFIKKFGKEAFYRWFLKFGFGAKTGIDLPNEVSGFLTPPQKWYAGDIGGLEMSIGQGLAVTPIQLITALNSIANGGYWIRPHVMNEILSPSGTLVSKYSFYSKRIFKQNVTRIVRSFMVDVVKKGTGRPAQLNGGVLVGGKTGTAEKPVNGKLSKKGPYFALFYGFFPASDPKYSILVIVDQPSKGKYYGEQVAAPVFREIGNYVLRLEGYGNHENTVRTFLPVIMPNLKGLTLNESLNLLKSLSIPASEINFSGNGVVFSQYPPPFTPISKIKNVKISLGPAF